MTARIGTCTGCGAQFGKIPPTMTATKVRCRKCGGEVVIPPLEAAPSPAPDATAAPEAAPAEKAAETPSGGLTATPLGDVKPKGNGERPASAAPVDRSVARPEPAKPAAKPAPKPPLPKKPVVMPPLPRKPVAKPAPPPPKPPAPKPPASKPAAPKAKAPQTTPPPAVPAEKKEPDKAAALMAQLKARKDAGAQKVQAAKEAGKSADPHKGADLMAKLKAKKSAEPGEQAPAATSSKTVTARKMPARPRPAAKRKSSGDDHGERHHHHPHVKKGPPVLLTLTSVIALGVIGYGIWWFLGNADKKSAPVPEEMTAADAPVTALVVPEAGDAGDAAASVPKDAGSGEPDSAEAAAGDGQSSDAQPAEATAGGDGAAAAPAAAPPAQEPVGEDPEWSPPALGEEIAWRGYRFADSFKLELVPLLTKWDSTDDETWAGFVEDADLYLADEGASSTRAGNRLVEGSRDAYPAIVNAMLQTDWTDTYSIGLCHSLNNKVVEIGHGTNFGWKDVEGMDSENPEWNDAILFNKKVVVYWYNFWISKFSVDDEQWDGFATKHSEKKKKKKEGAKPADAPPPSGLDFDD